MNRLIECILISILGLNNITIYQADWDIVSSSISDYMAHPKYALLLKKARKFGKKLQKPTNIPDYDKKKLIWAHRVSEILSIILVKLTLATIILRL